MADYTIEVAVPNVGPQGPQGPAGEFGELEAPEDGIIYGRKDAEWVDMTSPANLQVRRGTAAEVAAITPLQGEPVWATDTKKLVVGDGSSLGGIQVGPRVPQFFTIVAGGNRVLSAGRLNHTAVSSNQTVSIDLPHEANQAGDDHLIVLTSSAGGFGAPSGSLTLRAPSTVTDGTPVAYTTLATVSSNTAAFFARNNAGTATGWQLVPASLAQSSPVTIADATDAASTQARLNDLFAVLRRHRVIL
jgi:hypothetical protein